MQERLEYFLRQKLQSRRDRLAKEAVQLREQQGDEVRELRGGDMGEDRVGEGDNSGTRLSGEGGGFMDGQGHGQRFCDHKQGSTSHSHEGPSDHSGAGDTGQVRQAGHRGRRQAVSQMWREDRAARD